LSDVVHDRLAHIVGQRHAIMPLAFAADQNRPVAPVNVVKPDGYDLRRSETQSCEHHEHRVVAPADRGRCPAGIEDLVDLVRLEIARQRAFGRLRHARDRDREVTVCLAAPE